MNNLHDSSKKFLVEFTTSGAYTRVVALDPHSGIEATVAMPSRGVTRIYMQQVACRMLVKKLANGGDKR